MPGKCGGVEKGGRSPTCMLAGLRRPGPIVQVCLPHAHGMACLRVCRLFWPSQHFAVCRAWRNTWRGERRGHAVHARTICGTCDATPACRGTCDSAMSDIMPASHALRSAIDCDVKRTASAHASSARKGQGHAQQSLLLLLPHVSARAASMRPLTVAHATACARFVRPPPLARAACAADHPRHGQ